MKENEFIKGRWYIWINYHVTAPNGLKYVKADYIEGNQLYYSDRINVNNKFIYNYNNWCSWDEQLQLADMTEVSKFLPDNHPDKISELPKKWCVRANNGEEGKLMFPWAKEFYDDYGDEYVLKDTTNYYIHSDNGKNAGCYKNPQTGFEVLSFDKFKQYIMKKEIIGYKLKDEIFRDPALQLLRTGFAEHIPGVDIVQPTTIEMYRKALVLDLWFEPVYKESKVILKFGDTTVECAKGQGYVDIREGRITKQELESIINYFQNGPRMLKYKGIATTISYGCKSGTLEELVNIYNNI
jgi:hypothetical protein